MDPCKGPAVPNKVAKSGSDTGPDASGGVMIDRSGIGRASRASNRARIDDVLHCLILALLCLAVPAHAERVEMDLPAAALPKKTTALAVLGQYREGKPELPAVMILHGFLQTGEFHTVQQLANNLADAGYATLTPTLSLGIPRRAKSAACEALHTTGLEQDIAEIDAWVDWLKQRGHKRIAIAAHSFGSLQALAWLDARHDAAVRSFIGISLVGADLGMDEAGHVALIARLEAEAKANPRKIVESSLSFCKKYPAPTGAYLSYARWPDARVLDELDRVPVPVDVVLGGADTRLPADWVKRVGKTRAKVHVVDGANHFMDGQHEFDLLDTIQAILKGT
jgi:pimeloyl-ACP methyl ester carboxylesterase